MSTFLHMPTHVSIEVSIYVGVLLREINVFASRFFDRGRARYTSIHVESSAVNM